MPTQKRPDEDITLRIEVRQPDGKPYPGSVDVAVQHQILSDQREFRAADGSKPIAVAGLRRAPQGTYKITVTPTNVFTPQSQFVTIPASGFATVVVTVGESTQPVVEKERSEFHALLLENPNYFGGAPQFKAAPVAPMQGNQKYEELACIGLCPEKDLLEAIIHVNLPYGYKSPLCGAGSFEYVRFFIDWDGDGDFSEAGEDVGIASVNVHDIPDAEYPCVDKPKPLSYALSLKIDPKKRPCKYPQLFKVRAILSWDAPPTPGDPDFPVVWGNVLEKWVQIQPTDLLVAHVVDAIDFAKLGLDPSFLDLNANLGKTPVVSVADLEKAYVEKKVPKHRVNFAAVNQIAQAIKKNPALAAKYQLDPKFAEIKDAVMAVIKAEPNTTYEQLDCVGLDYNQDQLAATLRVKLLYGYGGGLCTEGTYEYVAFWLYIHDDIEQMCIWRHVGTTRVKVHDIHAIPAEGLQYAVSMPVDLSNYRRPCGTPVVLKARAILSWNHPPDVNDPNFRPVWGNRLEAKIQPKPGVPAYGEQIPSLWALGEMAVESIDGNPYTTVGALLGPGYANGVSLGAGFTANESPFGGAVKISGSISHAPDNPVDAGKLRYKVQYRKVGEAWKDIDNTFRIWIRIDGVPSGHLDQVASGGYFLYQKDLTAPGIREVQDDVLAIWNTPTVDGLYDVRLLLFKAGAPAAGETPADHVSSAIVKIMVDNTNPKAAITLDLGACTEFNVGDPFTGKFTATDDHILSYTLSVIPSTANPPLITSPAASMVYPLLPASGVTDVPFTVTTTADTTPCGYVIHLYVDDRTIRDNHMPGNRAAANVGLCLRLKQ